MKFAEIGTGIGQLVERKNAAYGSSFAKAGEFLRLLYPDGIRAHQYDDALLLVRIFDKQMRIATDRDALGESPYRDIAGYGILGAALSEARKETTAVCTDNASGLTAGTGSTGQSASAVRSAGTKTGATQSRRSARGSKRADAAQPVAREERN